LAASIAGSLTNARSENCDGVAAGI
jgi:hypothetical protein